MGDVAGAYLQHVVERTGDHQAGLDFGDLLYRLIEVFECAFAGLGEVHMDNHDMVHFDLCGIERGAVSHDHALTFQPLDPLRTGGFGKVYAFGEINYR